MHAYIHTYLHTYILTYIHTYIHACIHTYIHTYIHTHIHIYIYIYLQVRFHRNIATSSLAADCNVPQRPPAIIRNFTSIQMVHPHTHTHTRTHARRHARTQVVPNHTHKWILHIREDTSIIPGFTTSALELHRFGRTSWQGAELLDGGPGKP